MISIEHIRLERVDSTNNYAKSDELRGLIRPFVISAREQYSGRGQRGNVWHSKAGANIMLSYVCSPNINAREQFRINEVASLAVIDFCAAIGIQARIKWPNDILVSDRKIAGILIENTLRGPVVTESIIGIGFNLNQIMFDAAAGRACSAVQVTGRVFDYETSIGLFVDALHARVGTLSGVNNGNEYLSNMYNYGQVQQFTDASGKRFAGVIAGVDANGCLLVNMPDGIKKAFAFKEIAFIFAT